MSDFNKKRFTKPAKPDPKPQEADDCPKPPTVKVFSNNTDYSDQFDCIKESLESICTKVEELELDVDLTSVVTSIETLCEKVENLDFSVDLTALLDAIQLLCDKLEAQVDPDPVDLTPIIILIEALCEKIEDLINVQPDIVECCTEALPARYCANVSGLSGNGNPASEVNIVVGGVDVPLPVDYNTADIIAALSTNGQVFTEEEGGRICSVEPFSVILNGRTAAGDPPDIVYTLFAVSIPALLNPPVDAVCTNYARVWTKREDEILACLQEQKMQNSQMFDKMCQMVDKVCELVGDPDEPCPDCPEVEVDKTPVVYENSDNTTEMTISVGGSGDVKIDSGSGDDSEAAVIACIESCLAAGDDVAISWTTVDGGSGTATLLAAAQTTAFPNFYNQSTDATGDSGKLLTLTCG